MHKLDNGYKSNYNPVEMKRLFENYHKETFKCKCGHSVFIPKDMNKRLCSFCGTYVFREKKDEFIFRLKELIK